MTWNAYHRRGEVLSTAIATADARLDGRLPTDLDGVRATFADDLDLLGTLQLRWHTRLSGRIDAALATQPLDLEEAVATAWAGTAADMPGVRAILDGPAADEIGGHAVRVMAGARAKERAMLAAMAGRSSFDDSVGAVAGAAIEERARQLLASGAVGGTARSATTDPGASGLLGRLRAALAA
ncbi:hypothetical protein [Nocardioides alkalitolerans]|uniref:hypothetical protein n=1 Tax=Nocardioides alkalitolerans TaxID=281714 RepID=UPI00048C6728|nr:hypothetical protein [Nocardioides alkalitolerans]